MAAHDVREAVVDSVKCWLRTVEIPANRFLAWLGLAASKYDVWQDRYGKAKPFGLTCPPLRQHDKYTIFKILYIYRKSIDPPDSSSAYPPIREISLPDPKSSRFYPGQA